MAAACVAPLQGLDQNDHQWFAVQVRTGREQLSATHLRLRGYEIFLPCYCEHRQWSDRVRKIDRPLFPGYLFTRFGRDVVARLVTAPGVIRLVGTHAGPVPIPTGEVEAIQRIVETRLLAEPWPFLQVGERVHVDVGPLRGTTGIVLATKSRHRLVVSISLLQRSVAVEMDPAWVSIPYAQLVTAVAP